LNPVTNGTQEKEYGQVLEQSFEVEMRNAEETFFVKKTFHILQSVITITQHNLYKTILLV